MSYIINNYFLRKIESSDIDFLYDQKNDYSVIQSLGGFSMGYSKEDIKDWIEFHRKQRNEYLWGIIDTNNDSFLGHVGFYNVDFRVRSAEFAIMIGNKNYWGKGIGKLITNFVVELGFNELNFNRIYLSVLSDNSKAINLYSSVGFIQEGILRQSNYKNGFFLDSILMSILRDEYIKKPNK